MDLGEVQSPVEDSLGAYRTSLWYANGLSAFLRFKVVEPVVLPSSVTHSCTNGEA